MADVQELTVREALSGISGSISIVAWLFLLLISILCTSFLSVIFDDGPAADQQKLPQLYENYRNSSAEGLSMTFLIIWFLGDVANLTGAIWDALLPTVIAIGVYFCFIDASLISQASYYNLRDYRKRQKRGPHGAEDVNDPHRPLLSNDSPIDNEGSDIRGHSAANRRRSSAAASLPYVKDSTEPRGAQRWIRNLLAIFGVCFIGAAAWAVTWKSGWWAPTPLGDEDDSKREVGAEILGYASAVLYLGARLPQIWKNYSEKSCEGLSLLFFMLSTLGNLSYGTQILFHSLEREYVLKNLPWLIGSVGTILEDVIIFLQFQIYAKPSGSGSMLD